MEPEVAEAEASEDLGYFFKRLGEICFSAADAQRCPGPASSLAVAPRAGAVFYSDAEGEINCRSRDHHPVCLLCCQPTRAADSSCTHLAACSCSCVCLQDEFVASTAAKVGRR